MQIIYVDNFKREAISTDYFVFPFDLTLAHQAPEPPWNILFFDENEIDLNVRKCIVHI